MDASQAKVEGIMLRAGFTRQDGSGWDGRYQCYLNWKFGLNAKGFFSIRHETILQVMDFIKFHRLPLFIVFLKTSRAFSGDGNSCNIFHLYVSTGLDGEF